MRQPNLDPPSFASPVQGNVYSCSITFVYILKHWAHRVERTKRFIKAEPSVAFGLNIFYLYTLYIEQHIKTYNNIQYTNGIQKKVSRLIRICIPFKISILLIISRFREKTISVPMLNLVRKCTTRVWKLFN